MWGVGMKRNRVIFCIMWILSLVGISFFGGAASYGLFALLTLAPVVSFAYLLCVMAYFRIYQELDSRNLVANHTVPFYFTLMNEYFFGFAGIKVRFFSSFSTISGLDDGVEYELLPKTGIQKQTSLLCKYRGEYEVGIKYVEMQDFLRLFRIIHHNRETLRVMVRPDLVELEELHGIDDMEAMARESLTERTEPDVVVRRFEQGDDLKHVNWKASARSGELLTRRFVGEEREGVSILLGTWRCSGEQLEYLPVENKMLETALAIALFFAKRKIPVTTYFLTDDIRQEALSGLEGFDAYYGLISALEFREEQREGMFLERLSGNRELFSSRTAFLILHELGNEADGMARLLSENHVGTYVYWICDQVPEHLPVGTVPRVQVRRIGTDEDLRNGVL